MHQRACYCPPVPVHAAAEASADSAAVTQLGTILYHGPVPPAKGDWYGIEWDDVSRGRHSGVYEKTGKRYFETRVEGAGSFLRTDAKGLDVLGKPYIKALSHKYLEDNHVASDTAAERTTAAASASSDAAEGSDVQRFATSSNFDVEVVLDKKVTDRFKQLGRLHEVGLEWEGVSSALSAQVAPDTAAAERDLQLFGAQLKSLEGLNLSYTMLPTLQEASTIAAVLPRLSRLSLNANRFRRIDQPARLSGFERLTALQLNHTLMSWSEIRNIAPSLPNLVDLQFGSNRLRRLSDSPRDTRRAGRQPEEGPILPRLERLNLEANELEDWDDLIEELSKLPRLQELVLSDNHLKSLALTPRDAETPSIEAPEDGARPVNYRTLPQLQHLSLSGNCLDSWASSFDELGRVARDVFPSLTSLRAAGNPVLTSGTNGNGDIIERTASLNAAGEEDAVEGASLPSRREAESRLLVIARLSFLKELDGTPVRPVERTDAERFWLERVRDGVEPVGGLSPWANKRIAELRMQHPDLAPGQGPAPTGSNATTAPRTIKSRLLRLTILPASELPHAQAPSTSPLELSVLPTLRTTILRTQISRLLGTPIPKTKYRLLADLKPASGSNDRVQVEIPPNEEGKEVSWWGLEDGDAVQVLPL
ncbi:hypothetical protein JCM10908_004794 [Rhodotorula pacifica]|uniref:Pac2p n=1 Tax=Rhodotorula pacifica TaxID=1495444 RepID=UPI00317BFD0C